MVKIASDEFYSLIEIYVESTENVDIFTCIHFSKFTKNGNFKVVHIFVDI